MQILWFATKSLYNGAKIKGIATILGHSNIETTENYCISSLEENRIKVNNILENTIQSDVINKIVNFEDFSKKDWI